MNDTKLNDGGPAFAEVVQVEIEGQGGRRGYRRVGGLSKLEYFAASAPPSPAWFTAKLTPLPKQPAGAEFCEGCKSDNDCEKTLSCLAMQEHRQKEHATRELNKVEMMIQWRWFYADQMIAARTTESAPKVLKFSDAIKIAKGCFDYSGGHRDAARETFHHGIQTVINALEAADKNGLADTQVAVLHNLGSK